MKAPIAAIAALTLALSTAAFAAGVGDVLPALELKDAHDKAHTLSPDIRRIYFTPDRASGEAVKAAMPTQALLDAQQAVFIANIAEAPGFVKFIIRSSLKERPYATWLDVSGVTQPLIPARPGHITVVELDRRRIVAIRYAADAAALKQELN